MDVPAGLGLFLLHKFSKLFPPRLQIKKSLMKTGFCNKMAVTKAIKIYLYQILIVLKSSFIIFALFHEFFGLYLIVFEKKMLLFLQEEFYQEPDEVSGPPLPSARDRLPPPVPDSRGRPTPPNARGRPQPPDVRGRPPAPVPDLDGPNEVRYIIVELSKIVFVYIFIKGIWYYCQR
jgi:hypothetical protein